ncbi:MAG: zinc-dependent metalloprotease [Planctomycetota bacterium]
MRKLLLIGIALGAWLMIANDTYAQKKPTPKPSKKAALSAGAKKNASDGFKKYADVTKGYKKVVSTTDGKSPLFDLWVRKKDGHTLAEFAENYAKTKYFLALTVSTGEIFAGLHSGDRFVYLKRFDKRLAIIAPELSKRSSGNADSKTSVNRIFTDRVLADVPILCIGKRGGPVIDLDDLLLKRASAFFGSKASGLNKKLAALKVSKAFPKNVEVAYEAPVSGGKFKRFHFSISSLPEKTGYKPRKADQRVGFFVTSYQDLAKYRDDSIWQRYINRWHIEKADPKLKLSPPKKPIVFYIEHTTPVRYRRFVRDGILYWNKAFRAIGIDEAVVVHYQDAQSGAHMDKNPEDVRYNFVRWLNNDVGTAIGPSRVDPRTGQILDADIILTDGWIRSFDYQFSKVLPTLATEGFSQETMEWLHANPNWDPRIIFAEAGERARMLAERAHPGHEAKHEEEEKILYGDNEFDGLVNTNCQENGFCMAATGKGFDLAMARMHYEVLALLNATDDEKKKDSAEDILDGMPASFIGPLLADLVAHECGHTLGLRHNFVASSIYTMAQINSNKVKGKAFTASVMDYNPININLGDGEVQGDYCMIDIGPYDMWAIEYGYTLDEKALPGILARCTESELAYLTDEDTSGPDPQARRYDFTKNPLDYAKNQMRLAQFHRKHLLDKFVKKGDSWAKASRGYNITLSFQMRSLSMMANWIGGAHTRRHKKGDGDQPPITVVSGNEQREALDFLIKSSFKDEAFGLSSDLLRHMTQDKWFGSGDTSATMADVTFPIHDRIVGIQNSVLTMILNPTTLRRVLDNESLTDNEDALTLAEMMSKVSHSIWSDLKAGDSDKTYTARKPCISSIRRNLQSEHIKRLIDLSYPKGNVNSAHKQIATLARMHLRRIGAGVTGMLPKGTTGLDDYSRAHLEDVQARITKALEAQFTLRVK